MDEQEPDGECGRCPCCGEIAEHGECAYWTVRKERDKLREKVSVLEFDQRSYITRLENSKESNRVLRERVATLDQRLREIIAEGTETDSSAIVSLGECMRMADEALKAGQS